jgi:hypothetical protein
MHSRGSFGMKSFILLIKEIPQLTRARSGAGISGQERTSRNHESFADLFQRSKHNVAIAECIQEM